MALFVTLVVVLILYVLVYQLWHSALLESRIAGNQGGYMKSQMALQSVIGYVVAMIQDDLVQDVGGEGVDAALTEGMEGTDAAKAGDTRAARGEQEAAAATGGIEEVGATATAPGAGGLYDYRNESLFRPRVQQINDVSVKIEVRDGESRINLNKLYGYVNLWVRKESEIEQVGEDGGGDAKSKDDKKATTTKERAEEEKKAEDRDKLEEILGPGAEALDEEEEEWEEPDEEERDAARRMLADLIIHMVESNIENGFEYDQLYDADQLGELIEDYVFQRKAGDIQNFLFTPMELLQIDAITYELFHGPLPPELKDTGIAVQPGEEGYRRDEFGDVVYDFGFLGEDMPGMGGMSGMGGMGDLGGLDALREELMGYGGFNPGVNSMAGPPVPDNEEGTGIVPPPEPVGLKHLLCTFSSGKININTAPMEVILALLQGGGEPDNWDPDEKLEIGLAIIEHLNGYTEDYLEQLEEEDLGGYGAYDEAEEDYLSDRGVAPAEDLPTNYFRSLADLKNIGEGELLETEVDRGSSEQSPGNLLNKDLQTAAVFSSEYFLVRVVAKGEGFRQEAEFVVHRDIKKKVVSVEYFRERQD